MVSQRPQAWKEWSHAPLSRSQIIVPDGTVLEGHGVIPDIRVELDRELLLQEIDSQLEAAIEYLKQDVPQGCFERDQPSAKEKA